MKQLASGVIQSMCVPIHYGDTTMLNTLPYADLLAIHNALAEKPARRFDTRANGEKRTLALMEARGLTLEEAARLADVILGDNPVVGEEPPDENDEHEPGNDSREVSGSASKLQPSTIVVAAEITPLITAFIVELAKPDRPAYLATFLRRIGGELAHGTTSRERQMTASQKTIIALCERPQGATGKELADGCGWPSIAARATCQKLADRFGYALSETPRTKERGISFHMTAKQTVEV